MGHRICLAAAIAIGGCRHPPPSAPPPAAAPIDAGVVVVAAPPSDAPPPITGDECGAYVDHVLGVAMAAMRTTRSADQVPTAEQVATIREELVASQPCRDLTRGELACAMTARDQPALYACAGVTAPR